MEGYKELYFSFKGRATRSDLWIRFYLVFFLGYFAMILFDTTLILYDTMGVPILTIIYSLVGFYASLAVSVKRAHDRNRSGWFILLYFVPFINLWPIIELSFFRGTKGENRFGQDLLA